MYIIEGDSFHRSSIMVNYERNCCRSPTVYISLRDINHLTEELKGQTFHHKLLEYIAYLGLIKTECKPSPKLKTESSLKS